MKRLNRSTPNFTRSWRVWGLTALLAVPVIGADSVAMQARGYDDQDRSTPRTTENADTDPQPYYVDGVQYKPYVSTKKKQPPKAPEASAAPVATQAAPAQLKPYVPGTTSAPANPVTNDTQTAGHSPNPAASSAQASSNSVASRQSNSSSKAANAPAAVTGPLKKRPRYASAIIQSLDKVTTETVRFEVPVGKSVRYKGLIYTVKACETTTDEEMQQDVMAYMQVRTSPTITPNMVDPPKPKEIFSGWSFASSPGINPIQHPIYDAWVIGCKNPIT